MINLGNIWLSYSCNQCLQWQAAGRHDNLTSRNMEKKARWREEAQREKEEATALAAKAQWDASIWAPKTHVSVSAGITTASYLMLNATRCENSGGGGTDFPSHSKQIFRVVYKIKMWDFPFFFVVVCIKIK